jgi:hypothetical protein
MARSIPVRPIASAETPTDAFHVRRFDEELTAFSKQLMNLSQGPQRVDKVLDDVVHQNQVEGFRLERRSRQVADMDVDAETAVRCVDGIGAEFGTRNLPAEGSQPVEMLARAAADL